MSLKDLSTFNNRFSTGRATSGSTFTTINENVQVLGNLTGAQNISAGGALSVTGTTSLSSLGLSSMNVNSGNLTIDSNGNLVSIGTVGVSGNATFANLAATGAINVGGNTTMTGSLYPNNGIDVNAGKFTVDSLGHVVSQGNISALGNLSIGGVATFSNSITSSSTAYLNGLNVNAGKFTVDSLGNVVALGSLGVTGNATFSNINVSGTATVAGNLSMAGNITANGALGSNSLAVNTNKLTIDSNGNVLSLGTLGVTGNATFSNIRATGTLDVAGTSTFGMLNAGSTSITGPLTVSGVSSALGGSFGATGLAVQGPTILDSSVDVQLGKFVIDTSGNVGIGSTPSGAVMDIYNNNSRIRLRGTGTGIEWNNTGSAVMSSVIYDTDSKLKMYSSATQNPKIMMDANNVVMIADPSSATLTSASHTAITPVGIMTVTGVYTINVSQAAGTITPSGTDSTALLTYLGSNKAYLYIDDSNYRNRLLFPSVSGSTFTALDVLTGSAVSQTASATGVKVYVGSSVVANNGRIHSSSLVTPDNNPRVVVSNQYGQLSLSA
jgi:hypothetical protein